MSFESSPIMPSDLSTISTLSIYPDKKPAKKDEKEATKPDQIIGNTAMTFFSDIKARYNNTVKAIDDFKTYTSSTEGKVKLSIMFAGFAGGCVLAYRSPSKYLWYKRMIPFGTLSLAASACYPYKALAVAKTTSHGVVTTYNASKIAVNYCYQKLQKLKSDPEVNAVHIQAPASNPLEEKVYSVNEEGFLVSEESPEPVTQQKQSNAGDTSKDTKKSEKQSKLADDVVNSCLTETETILLSNNDIPLSPKSDLYDILVVPESVEKAYNSKKFFGDAGQGLPEDADLYTTR